MPPDHTSSSIVLLCVDVSAMSLPINGLFANPFARNIVLLWATKLKHDQHV